MVIKYFSMNDLLKNLTKLNFKIMKLRKWRVNCSLLKMFLSTCCLLVITGTREERNTFCLSETFSLGRQREYTSKQQTSFKAKSLSARTDIKVTTRDGFTECG